MRLWTNDLSDFGGDLEPDSAGDYSGLYFHFNTATTVAKEVAAVIRISK